MKDKFECACGYEDHLFRILFQYLLYSRRFSLVSTFPRCILELDLGIFAHTDNINLPIFKGGR